MEDQFWKSAHSTHTSGLQEGSHKLPQAPASPRRLFISVFQAPPQPTVVPRRLGQANRHSKTSTKLFRLPRPFFVASTRRTHQGLPPRKPCIGASVCFLYLKSRCSWFLHRRVRSDCSLEALVYSNSSRLRSSIALQLSYFKTAPGNQQNATDSQGCRTARESPPLH